MQEHHYKEHIDVVIRYMCGNFYACNLITENKSNLSAHTDTSN